jgi:hypothetical protein
MESRPSYAAAAVLLLGCGSALAAEQGCSPTDTINECWDKASGAPIEQLGQEREARSDAAADDVEERLKRFETGLDGGSPALATTTKNLLPLLSMAGLISDSDGNAEDNLFTLDLNFLIPTLAVDNNAQLKAVLNTQPTLFEPLADTIKAGPGGTDEVSELESDLDAADDYMISFTYSHINDRFGRSFKQYQQRFSNIFEAMLTQATSEAGTTSVLRLADFIAKNIGNREMPEEIGDQPGLQQAIETAARDEAALERRVRELAASNYLAQFAELVNNQPQLTASAEFRERDDLVGVREQAIKVAYEFGRASVGDFEKTEGSQCNGAMSDVANAQRCLNAYRQYIESHADYLRNADRFVAGLSYVDLGDYSFTQNGVNVARSGSNRLDLSVGYGRTLRALGADRDSRFDFVAKYEDYSDDPDRRDRLLATLTFTTKLNGFSIPVALVYANHGQFMPEVDEELSAHIGFKFNLDTKTDEE